jgi:predicted TIM-barrel fold metal-dependent hydrolase
MKYYDAHLHFASPDLSGLTKLKAYLANEKDSFVGGNLILNTPRELEFALQNKAEVPPNLNWVPFWDECYDYSNEECFCGWFKIHPVFSKIRPETVNTYAELVAANRHRIRGLIVHAFPWGDDLIYRSSLELVLALAKVMPDTPILCSHGGGYQSWEFRAHTASIRNVYYDFSATAIYYADSDYVIPLKVYLNRCPERVIFASDYPTGTGTDHLQVYLRMALKAGMDENALERLLLKNSMSLWTFPEGGA